MEDLRAENPEQETLIIIANSFILQSDSAWLIFKSMMAIEVNEIGKKSRIFNSIIAYWVSIIISK